MEKYICYALLAILAIGLLILNGCDKKFTEKQNGKEVALKAGTNFSIYLEGNPTTGYNWQVKDYDRKIIEQVGKEKYSSEGDKIGTGGHFTFNFKALLPGKTKLELAYLRPWEENVPPIETFEVILRIK
ncbi:MAG: protease inhibitor I42 family protein [Candidatus Margulisiibacteriota bacterium]|nr:protease inhibitor I42 family protein [Candidatus Margulisiibacteriota bacterium]